jgi:hypothetical protein
MPRRAFGVAVVFVLAALIARVDAAGAVGLGGSCAGTEGLGCDAGLWCQLQSGRCGSADAEGTCVHVAQICNMVFKPVCACGGKTYGNDCELSRAKAQKAHNGPCGLGSGRAHHVEPDASKNQ